MATAPTDIASLLNKYVKQLKAKGVPNDKIKAVLLKFREQLMRSDAKPTPAPTPGPTPAPASKPAPVPNSKIPVNSTINRPEGQFVKTATGWVSKTTGRPVIPGKAKALDAQMMAVLQRRGLSESRKPVHVRFVRAAKKKVTL
jgi:hypothetical protein